MTNTRDNAASAVSLRREITEVVDRIARLKMQRCALEEARDDLEVHERDLEQRLTTARQTATGPGSLSEAARRARELDAEIIGTRHEIASLERRCSAGARRLEALSREAAALGGELRAQRGEASAAEVSLQDVEAALRRMGRKLVFAQRKYAGSSGE